MNKARLPNDFYTTMFDYGVYTPLNEVSPDSIKVWVQRNLSLGGIPSDVYTPISEDMHDIIAKGLHNDPAFGKYLQANDKDKPSAAWVTYLAFIGNYGYNERVGGNVPLDEMFHYKDAILNNPTEICGSKIPTPVLVAKIFKEDHDMKAMFARRTNAYFPELHFDMDAWEQSLVHAAKTISAIPEPKVEDFCHGATSKYTELTDHNCEHVNVLPSLHACVSEAWIAAKNPDEFKQACVAISKAPLLACTYANADREMLLAHIQETSVEVPEVDYSISADEVIDPYDEYEKQVGPVKETEISDDEVADFLHNRTKEYVDAIRSHLDKSAPSAFGALVTMLAMKAAHRNMPKDELIEKVSNKAGIITPEAISEQLREFDREEVARLQNPHSVSM